MDKNQEAAIEEYSDDLIKVLRPSLNESVLPYLMFRKVITPEDRLAIEKRLSDFDKVYQLFEILKAKVKGWQGLIDFLKHEGQTVLAAKLENLAKATASSKDSSTAGGHAGEIGFIDTKKQVAVLKKFRSDLVDNLHFDEIVPFLNKKNLLQQAGIEVVKRREVTDEGRLLYLLDMMINKDGWWKALMEFLENHNLAPLKFTLMEAMEKCN